MTEVESPKRALIRLYSSWERTFCRSRQPWRPRWWLHPRPVGEIELSVIGGHVVLGQCRSLAMPPTQVASSSRTPCGRERSNSEIAASWWGILRKNWKERQQRKRSHDLCLLIDASLRQQQILQVFDR